MFPILNRHQCFPTSQRFAATHSKLHRLPIFIHRLPLKNLQTFSYNNLKVSNLTRQQASSNPEQTSFVSASSERKHLECLRRPALPFPCYHNNHKYHYYVYFSPNHQFQKPKLILFSHLRLRFRSGLSLFRFLDKLCMNISFPSYVLHSSPISLFLL